MSSSWTLIEELDGACNWMHKSHNHQINGRAKGADIYPPELSGDMQGDRQAKCHR